MSLTNIFSREENPPKGWTRGGYTVEHCEAQVEAWRRAEQDFIRDNPEVMELSNPLEYEDSKDGLRLELKHIRVQRSGWEEDLEEARENGRYDHVVEDGPGGTDHE